MSNITRTALIKRKCQVCKFDKRSLIVEGNIDKAHIDDYKRITKRAPICKRCWRYYKLTRMLKHASGREMRGAKQARKFSQLARSFFRENSKIVYDDKIFDEFCKYLFQKLVS